MYIYKYNTHVRSTDYPNLIHILATIVVVVCWLPLGKGSHQKLQIFEFEWHICCIQLDTGFQLDKRSSSLNFPAKIVALITLFIIYFTESLIPFQRRGGFMFRRRMMGTQIFNGRMCVGKKKFIMFQICDWNFMRTSCTKCYWNHKRWILKCLVFVRSTQRSNA